MIMVCAKHASSAFKCKKTEIEMFGQYSYDVVVANDPRIWICPPSTRPPSFKFSLCVVLGHASRVESIAKWTRGWRVASVS